MGVRRLPAIFGMLIAMTVLGIQRSEAATTEPIKQGGWIEKADSDRVRDRLNGKSSGIPSFINKTPQRGRFTFKAPYNTKGVRLTIPEDCTGLPTDCINYVGYSYWRNMNNHDGRSSMWIFLGIKQPTCPFPNQNTIRSRVALYAWDKDQSVSVVGRDTDGEPALLDENSEATLGGTESGEGWYWSASNADAVDANLNPTPINYATLYITNHARSSTDCNLAPVEKRRKLYRYDVYNHILSIVGTSATNIFDIKRHFNPNDSTDDKYINQAHSSNNDNIHSATVFCQFINTNTTCTDGFQTTNFPLDSHGNRPDVAMGCIVYDEPADTFTYFPREGAGDFDECQIDKSGEWLLIKENSRVVNPGQPNEETKVDSRIIKRSDIGNPIKLPYDPDTNTSNPHPNQQFWAFAHTDNGFGYVAGGAHETVGPSGKQRQVDFDQTSPSGEILDGPIVYHDIDTTGVQIAAGHISHTNAKDPAITAVELQHACASNIIHDNISKPQPRSDEIVCFRLDTSKDVLVVAPTMASHKASGGGDDYGKDPKGNLDITGRYFIWTANMFGNRLDAFIVEVPTQLLVGEPDTGSLPLPWTSQHIGTTPPNGTTEAANFANETFTVTAAGAGIGGTSDDFLFVSQPLGTNDTIIAQVGGLLTKDSNGNPQNTLEMAGVMIRESTAANALSIFVGFTQNKKTGVCIQTRTSSTTSASKCVKNNEPPKWVKLKRSMGNVFFPYVSADGNNWTQIGSKNGYTISMSPSSTILAGIAVTSHNASVLTTASFRRPVVTIDAANTASLVASASTRVLTDDGLMAWQDQDIGSVGLAGSSSLASGTYTVKGSGFGPTNSDQFHFLYQTLEGDGTIIAKVTQLQNTADGFSVTAFAGVMIRETLDANSKFAMATMLKPSLGATIPALWYRTLTGIYRAGSTGGSNNLPVWVKLTRTGSTFTAYSSSGGSNWTSLGSITIEMATTVYIGLAVSSYNNTALNTSKFTNVEVLPSAGESTDDVVLTDDFVHGNTTGWTLSPTGYWSVVNGQLKATGTTTAGATQTSTIELPGSSTYWESTMAVPTTTSSHHGLTVVNNDSTFGVALAVDNNNNLLWQVMIDSVWQGWNTSGTVNNRSNAHRYAIQREGDATFTVLVDGDIVMTAIPAGPMTVWSGGAAYGTLFTDASTSGQHLNTVFSNVITR